MNKILSVVALAMGLLGFSSCQKEEAPTPIIVNKVAGVAEKGPFAAGSSVNMYELNNNLQATGRIFGAKTDNLSAFSIAPPANLASTYIKLSVEGHFFNECSGNTSSVPISLEAITQTNGAKEVNANVNILTHLEVPRVMLLVSSGKSLAEAKTQAQKEVLKAFLITDKTIVPDETSITSNTTSANILIAVSSILLHKRSDTEFSEFVNALRADLADGEISHENALKIAESSFGLDFETVKANIQKKYKSLGKTVEVGNFQLFIDGDNDGQIGDEYTPISETVDPDLIYSTEEGVKQIMSSALSELNAFVQYNCLFDATYTRIISSENVQKYPDLKLSFDHNLNSNQAFISSFWNSAYKSINYNNAIVEKSSASQLDWFKKYQYFSKVYNAYLYLAMINLWGDVPYLTSTNAQDALNIRRTPQIDVANKIITTLEDAYTYLPETSQQIECSKYFAKALQAKAYLYMKNYAKALECLNTIIASKKYSLSGDVNGIYAGGSNESLFELPNLQNSNTPYVELIQKGDYVVLMRYAEILLMASEANYMLGNNDTALQYLNLVRERNSRSKITDANNIVWGLLSEWKNDLKSEGSYFFILKNLNQAASILNIEVNKLLIPIPWAETRLNTNITQNPGY